MITDYASLKQAVADWLARADLTAQIPTFIQGAHARINRELRVASMQVTITGLVSDSNTIQLPADCRKVQSVRVTWGGTPCEVKPLPPESLQDMTQYTLPVGYVVSGPTLQLVGGTGNPEFSLTYLQEVPLMEDDLDANWLLTREPMLYLYGALIEAAPYIQDDERVLIWATQFKGIMGQMQGEDEGFRYGNAPAMVLRGATP